MGKGFFILKQNQNYIYSQRFLKIHSLSRQTILTSPNERTFVLIQSSCSGYPGSKPGSPEAL